MDTRQKILDPQQAARAARQRHATGDGLTLLTGFFDPLLAAEAQAVEAAARPGHALFVLVEDPPEPLLSARARAELVAGLRVVDYVVLAGTDPAGLAEAIAPGVRMDRREAGLNARRNLIEHVHQRQKETR